MVEGREREAAAPAGGTSPQVAADLAVLLLPPPLLAAAWLLDLPLPAAVAEAALRGLADPVLAALALASAYAFKEDRHPLLYAAAVGLTVAWLGGAALAEVAPWAAAGGPPPAAAAGGTVAFVAVAALADLAARLRGRRREAGAGHRPAASSVAGGPAERAAAAAGADVPAGTGGDAGPVWVVPASGAPLAWTLDRPAGDCLLLHEGPLRVPFHAGELLRRALWDADRRASPEASELRLRRGTLYAVLRDGDGDGSVVAVLRAGRGGRGVAWAPAGPGDAGGDVADAGTAGSGGDGPGGGDVVLPDRSRGG